MSSGRDGRTPDSNDRRLRKKERQRRRQQVNPCYEKPKKPDAGVIVWKEVGAKGEHFSAILTWSEVTLDVDGFLLRAPVKQYHGQFQRRSPAGNVDADVRRFTVRAKDEDVNTTAKWEKRIREGKNWDFRFRVRASTGLGSKHDLSEWSDWSAWSKPTRVPLAPTNVRIMDKQIAKCPVDWDPPLETDDDELHQFGIEGFICEWSQSPTFASTYKKVRNITSSRKSIAIPKADLGPFYYARVRSYDKQGFKSAWIPATIGGNSDSGASPSGVKPGRGRRIAIPFTKPGEVIQKTYGSGWTADQDYTIVGVRARLGLHDAATHPSDGTPGGADMLINLRITDDSGTNIGIFTQDNRLKIDAGTHKDTNWIREDDSGFNRDTIAENETVYVKVAQVGSSRPGSDLVVTLILETSD